MIQSSTLRNIRQILSGTTTTSTTIVFTYPFRKNKKYLFDIWLTETTANNADLTLHVNAETTANHHYRQYLDVSDAVISSARANNNYISSIQASGSTFLQMEFTQDNNNKPIAYVKHQTNDQGDIQLQFHVWTSIDAYDNTITSLTITSTRALTTKYKVYEVD